MKTETLAELLEVRYGIDVQKEINLIPMQQLIRIYQRNNPLTINDTRQLLNDTAYSYMALACTALKLMFKLSVREIKEFIAEFRDLIDTLYKFNQFGLTEVVLAWYDIYKRDKTDDEIQEQWCSENIKH